MCLGRCCIEHREEFTHHSSIVQQGMGFQLHVGCRSCYQCYFSVSLQRMALRSSISRTFFYVWCALAPGLYGARCNKEDDDCHLDIRFKNNASVPVIFAQKADYGGGGNSCQLSGPLVQPGAVYLVDQEECWEDVLGDDGAFTYYVLDTLEYHPGIYYPCDSLNVYYHIISQHSVQVSDLQRSDFSLAHP